jgi:hypothetical protein
MQHHEHQLHLGMSWKALISKMAYFYSAATGGFYSTKAHGSRTIEVEDPEWTRPKIEVVDPAWERPMIEVDDPDAKPPLVKVGRKTVPDPQWTAPKKLVPDMKASPRTIWIDDTTVPHPKIEIENPDCRLPIDAAPIPDEDYHALMEAQCSGKRIVPDEKGLPIAVDQAPLTDEERIEVERMAIMQEMSQLDIFIPRALEDQWAATGFDTSLLPDVQQKRLARKKQLRSDLSKL